MPTTDDPCETPEEHRLQIIPAVQTAESAVVDETVVPEATEDVEASPTPVG